MINLQAFTDKMAISLSLLCALHCLTLPFIILLLPSVLILQLDNEAFHFWMVLAVLPTSAYALFQGCKRHRHYRLVTLAILGLLLLISAALSGEALLGDFWEKTLTVTGATLVTIGHYWNYRLCKHSTKCQLSE